MTAAAACLCGNTPQPDVSLNLRECRLPEIIWGLRFDVRAAQLHAPPPSRSSVVLREYCSLYPGFWRAQRSAVDSADIDVSSAVRFKAFQVKRYPAEMILYSRQRLLVRVNISRRLFFFFFFKLLQYILRLQVGNFKVFAGNDGKAAKTDLKPFM